MDRSMMFVSARLGSALPSTLPLCAMAIVTAGCPQDLGSGEDEFGTATEGTSGFTTDTGADETGGGGLCQYPEIVECQDRIEQDWRAEPIAGCDGAALADAVDPEVGDDDVLEWLIAIPDPENPGETISRWPALMEEDDPALVGAWSDLVPNDAPLDMTFLGHLPVHSIHRPDGKFLQFGYQHSNDPEGRPFDEANDKVVWYPPAPCSPWVVGIENCDTTFDLDPLTPEIEMHVHVNQEGGDPDMRDYSLFCAGHVNVPPTEPQELTDPVIVTIGGSQPDDVNASYPGTFLFTESLPFEPTGSPQDDYEWVQLGDLSTYRWYATGTVLATPGEIAVFGGVFHANASRACQFSAGGAFGFGDVECACNPENENDPFVRRMICGNDGRCDPEATPSAEFDYPTCYDEGAGSPGVDVGMYDGSTIEWEARSVGRPFFSYPQTFVIPDLDHLAPLHLGGKVVSVGSETGWVPGDGALLWDPTLETSPIVEVGGPSCTKGSSAVMYAPDRIMKFGGNWASPEGSDDLGRTTRTTEILDLDELCPEWRVAGATGMPRRYSQGVLLPDGTVFAGGGTLGGNVGNDPGAGAFNEREFTVFTTELFDGQSETWCRLADLPGTVAGDPGIYRGYHSQSFLLPDGRVYLGAGGQWEASESHYDYWLFAPPYLFRGPRPEVAFDPQVEMTNGIAWLETDSTFTMTHDGEVPIARVTMIKLAASTHQFDQEARFVELDFEDDNNELTISTPSSTCFATPGYYMIFVVSAEDLEQEDPADRGGVPSIGQYLALTGSCAEAEVTAIPPVSETHAPIGVNDTHADGFAGVRVSSGGEGSVLRFEHLRHSLLELCTAARFCPDDASIDLEVRFVSTTGQASVDPEDLLTSATIIFVEGVPAFADDGIEINVAGTEFNSQVDLGPGEHVVEICASLGLLSACIEQPLRIDPVLAGGDEDEYRAASIEPAALDLGDRNAARTLDLGDDDVAEVALPEGFVFPFFGEEVDTIWVGANGAIRVDEGLVPASNLGLPQSLGPHIAVYWDDLDPSAGGRVRTYYDGARFVVSWERVPVAAGGLVTAQAHLFADGRIELHYPSVTTGPTAYGLGATIGIQRNGDYLALSVDDDALLQADDAIAFDHGSSIASALRLPDSTPCADQVAVGPADVPICGGHGDVELSSPPVPTICAPHRDAIVGADVVLGDERQPLRPDGTVRLYAGDYHAHWSVMAPADSVFEEVAYLPVGERSDQLLRVRASEDPEVCCREDQTVELLPEGDGTPQYVAAYEASCVIATAGYYTLIDGAYETTILGGPGNDVIYGGAAANVILGSDGDDILLGGEGDDMVVGGPGNDIVGGKEDDDEVWGSAGDDTVYGWTGDDVLLPGPGLDATEAGDDDDSVVVLDLCEVEDGEVYDGGDGTDTLWLPAGVSVVDLENLGATVTGFESVETITGGAWGTAECLLDP